MQPTQNTASAHVNACALGTEELVAGFLAVTAVTSYTQGFFKTFGDEHAKIAKQAIGRARRRSHRLEITIPAGTVFVILIWPEDGPTDESRLALLDLDIPIEGGTFRWNPDTHAWEMDQSEA